MRRTLSSPKALINTIHTLLNSNRFRKAVSILFASTYPIPFPLYTHLFQLCSENFAIIEARKVESHLLTFCPRPPVYVLNRALDTYGHCGCLRDAVELFDEMPERDGGSWNAMIKAFMKGGHAEKGLGLFRKMGREGVLANEITFACVLGACADLLDVCVFRQIHGLVVKYGFCGNVILESSLVDVYGKCEAMSDARRMFDEIVNPNEVTWNVIVRRYLDVGDEEEAIILFFKIFRTNVRPLSFTFSNTLVACSGMQAQKEGMQIHGMAIKYNFEEDEVVSNSLTQMYAKCGNLESARRVFDHLSSRDLVSWTSIVSTYAMSGRMREAREIFNNMPERNVISWNALLAGYTQSLQWEEAMDFVSLMRRTTDDVDHVTLGLMLNTCAGVSDVELGKQVHAFIYRHYFHSNIFIANALLNMYGKCGSLKNARVLFSQMSQSRDSVSWNALLTSYSRNFLSEQAITLFGEMQWDTKPCKFTFGTLLAACANLFALEQGKQIHGFMIRNGYDMDMVIRGALVDMYSKCRCLAYALIVFKEADSRDVIIWNSIILGCSHNGRAIEALELFEWMKNEGVKPDHVTFQGVFLACLHAGCIELAGQYFHLMSDNYWIIPRIEHYECMIEIYCRYGCMKELNDFVHGLPFKPTVPMFERILTACREHGNSRLGEWATEQFKLESFSPFQSELLEDMKNGE